MKPKPVTSLSREVAANALPSIMRKRQPSLPAHVLKDRVIQRLREAEHALVLAVDIRQTKLVVDVTAAQEILARRQQLGDDVIGYAHAINISALAQLGDLLKLIEKQHGARGRPGKGQTRSSKREPRVGAPPPLSEYGISTKTSFIAQQLAGLPAETREAIARREMTIAEARRQEKSVAMRTAVALPSAKYRVIYADPPWRYNDVADAGAIQSGGAAHQYATMSIADLCALDVVGLCAADAVLFLWVTSPLLFECAPVIAAWGFSYKASFVWDKVRHNMGHYNSVRHEFLLVCTRGSCLPEAPTSIDSVQSIERSRKHSEKPAEFRAIIAALYPHGKRIELFARGAAADGWDAWGNEVETDA